MALVWESGGLAAGQTLGRYTIVRVVGQGGMGTVHEAMDERLKRAVALKTIHPHLMTNQQVRERFRQEAEVLAKLRHANLVSVTDFDEVGGVAFIVMDYLKGESLRTRLERTSTMTPQQVAELVAPICAALAVAHDAGVVHRDLKPDNILLERGRDGHESPTLIDFGICKLVDGVTLTEPSMLIGSLPYMAPEQVQSARSVDARCDQYSLGVILYECVAGKSPFVGMAPVAAVAAILAGRFDLLRSRVQSVDPGFDAIVSRAMQLDPSKRFGSVTELGQALSAFVAPTQQVVTTESRARTSAPASVPPTRVQAATDVLPINQQEALRARSKPPYITWIPVRSPEEWEDRRSLLHRWDGRPYGLDISSWKASGTVNWLMGREVDADLPGLLTLPQLSNLRGLRLSGTIDARGAATLLHPSVLRGLLELSLNETGLGVEGLLRLMQAPELSRLQMLEVLDEQAGSRLLEAIVRSPHLHSLCELRITRKTFPDEAWSRGDIVPVPERTSPGSLLRLQAFNLGLTPRDLVRLTQALAGAPLAWLDLGGNPIGNEGAESRAEFLRASKSKLAVLGLDHAEIGERGAAALSRVMLSLMYYGREAPYVELTLREGLRSSGHINGVPIPFGGELHLRGNRLGDAGAVALFGGSPHTAKWLECRELRESVKGVDLRENGITAGGAGQLLRTIPKSLSGLFSHDTSKGDQVQVGLDKRIEADGFDPDAEPSAPSSKIEFFFE